MAMPVDQAVAVADLSRFDLTPDPCALDDGGVPPTLACTGLYSDFAAKTVAADVQAYAPGYVLWSDGADKSRYILIPAGTKIDVSALDNWVFPVGTKLWKEFSLSIAGVETRVETRLFWKRAVGNWAGVVYRWSDDQLTAPRFPGGLAMVPGTTYEIPAEDRCVECHHGKNDAPLGFEAVMLSAPTATGLTFAQLQTDDLLTATNGNAQAAVSTLQIPGDATEAAALGHLHSNCGIMCHRPGGGGPFRLDIDVSSGMAPADVMTTNAFAAINQMAYTTLANPPYTTANYYRIRPTDVTRSMIHLRMNVRDAPPGQDGIDQMPPLLSHTVDTVGLGQVDAWINAMTAAPYPAPAAP